MTESQGILAIWNDVRAGHETEFDAWFQSEHLLERLAVPGFLFGRRHEAISGSAGVRSRSAGPTAWTSPSLSTSTT